MLNVQNRGECDTSFPSLRGSSRSVIFDFCLFGVSWIMSCFVFIRVIYLCIGKMHISDGVLVSSVFKNISVE